jgi:hypothetical protein
MTKAQRQGMIQKAMTKLFEKIVTHHKDVFASKIESQVNFPECTIH